MTSEESTSNYSKTGIRDEIYGNKISSKDIQLILERQQRFLKEVDFNPNVRHILSEADNQELGPKFGASSLVDGGKQVNIEPTRAIICTSSKESGYGPHRAGLSVISCANALGLKPYWLDPFVVDEHRFESQCWQQSGYKKLLKRSQESKLFNKTVFEPYTTGQSILWLVKKYLDKSPNTWSWNDIKISLRDESINSLFAGIYSSLPKNVPVISTMAFHAQAAVAAGLTNVNNMILDNLPVAFWLAEGSWNYVQSASEYYGYRSMNTFSADGRVLKPIPSSRIKKIGHIVDHEIVANIETDCAERLSRSAAGEPRRFLLSMGGMGWQLELFEKIIDHLIPSIEANKATIFVNLGNHRKHIESLLSFLRPHKNLVHLHQTWDDTEKFVEEIRTKSATGVHIFLYDEMLNGIYATNYLMRYCDVMMTKPSELAFYPVPKICMDRVGGYEAWGAIRAAEIGDGTPEINSNDQIMNAVDLFMEDDDLLQLYCDSIIKNKSIGLYNGGYDICKAANQRAKEGGAKG